jgi:hypothetical protein
MPAKERLATSHSYPLRSLPQGCDNLVLASGFPMGSGSDDMKKLLADEMQLLRQEWRQENTERDNKLQTTLTAGFHGAAGPIRVATQVCAAKSISAAAQSVRARRIRHRPPAAAVRQGHP